MDILIIVQVFNNNEVDENMQICPEQFYSTATQESLKEIVEFTETPEQVFEKCLEDGHENVTFENLAKWFLEKIK